MALIINSYLNSLVIQDYFYNGIYYLFLHLLTFFLIFIQILAVDIMRHQDVQLSTKRMQLFPSP